MARPTWWSLISLAAVIPSKTPNYIFPRVWLNGEYNKYELPPTEDNQPVVVNVSIYLSSIIKIDDPTQVSIYTIFFAISSYKLQAGFLFYN